MLSELDIGKSWDKLVTLPNRVNVEIIKDILQGNIVSNLSELPEDYWARQARQNKLLDKLRKIKQEENDAKQILLARR
jgi:hypothetical protein